jgi:hypothetical protein
MTIVPGRWGRAVQVSGPSMLAVVTSMPCAQRRMVARSSSSSANFGLAVQLVHNKTVNGLPVPVCDVVTLIHPMPTRGEPAGVIAASAGCAKTSGADAVVAPRPRPTSVSSADFPVNGVRVIAGSPAVWVSSSFTITNGVSITSTLRSL